MPSVIMLSVVGLDVVAPFFTPFEEKMENKDKNVILKERAKQRSISQNFFLIEFTRSFR
jgi:hypothetical protein